MFIRYDPDKWTPQQGTGYHTYKSLEVGQITVWERRPYRVVEVRERDQTDWPERFRDMWVEANMPNPATWYRRPMVVVLQDIDQPTAKPLHLMGPADAHWDVIPEHYWVCRLCGELPPCREVHTNAVMARAAERMAEEMAIMPGCCHACREPITRRQKAIVFTGPNLIRPDLPDGSVIFHQRNSCSGSAVRYDERWAKATGNKRRFYCGGHMTVHLDKSTSCTEMAECPGDVSHRSREWHHPEHRDRFPQAEWCWCLAGAEAPARTDDSALF
ncbi:hypothetical protein [Streptacidiphilus carbonis]|uniref:hypothetical protein n=1 Tax=Streptacidiphilus carbonis TaxID=105422 RepID=UPI0006938477|nr:hypothetical protein [Streptacidiphilus carbonis]